MDELTKFNNQTAGRDKVFRLAQYTSRIIWYTLSKRKSCEKPAERAKKLDESLGLMRRLLRFGRFYESIYSALPVMTSVSDPVIRICSVLSRISSSCFMLIDHIVCLDKLGVLPPQLIDASKWDRTSTRFWLYSITLGLVRDFYEIARIYKEEFQNFPRKSTHKISSSSSQQNRRLLTSSSSSSVSSSTTGSHQSGDGESNRKELKFCYGIVTKNPNVVECVDQCRLICRCVRDHADVAVDTLKNLCDLCLPLNTLGFIKLTPATVGLLGVCSTIASALPQINPMIKMVPAT